MLLSIVPEGVYLHLRIPAEALTVINAISCFKRRFCCSGIEDNYFIYTYRIPNPLHNCIIGLLDTQMHALIKIPIKKK